MKTKKQLFEDKVRRIVKEEVAFADLKQDIVKIINNYKNDLTGPEKSANEILNMLGKKKIINQNAFRIGTF